VSQVNLNVPDQTEHVVREDRSTAAGINLITVLIVVAVIAVLAWFLFTGPLSNGIGGGTTNVNINPQPSTVNVNPAPQQPAPAPANNTTGNGTTGAPAGGAGNQAPARP
jgi:hypothetical protein